MHTDILLKYTTSGFQSYASTRLSELAVIYDVLASFTHEEEEQGCYPTDTRGIGEGAQ